MTPQPQSLLRRAFSRAILLGALRGLLPAAPADNSIARLAWDTLSRPEFTFERRYRADAQIVLLSVPVLRREGVGAGSMLWRDSLESSRSRLRLIEFNGFSIPARAAGLNRSGFIREMARMAEGAITESLYFGLMTSSPEESAQEARIALHSPAKDAAYTAIDGRIASDGIDSVMAHFTAPPPGSPESRAELMERARQSLASGTRKLSGLSIPPAGAQSFLHAVERLLRTRDGGETKYVYSGLLYRLKLRGAPDAKATALFQERRLAVGSVRRIFGKIINQNNVETNFRLWVEQDAQPPLPLRIEYQAKSYLKLVFEAV